MKHLKILLCAMIIPFSLSAQEIYREDFNANAQGWYVGTQADYNAAITGGTYVLENKTTSGRFFFNNAEFNENADWTIESNITQLAGITDHGYGIAWGAKDYLNQYCFIATSGGSYMIYSYKDGQYSPIQSWSDAVQAINPPGFVNKFTIKKTGNKLAFFINDQMVFTSEYEKFLGNKIGVILNDRMKISVEDIKVSIHEQISYDLASLGTIFSDEFNDNSKGWLTTSTSAVAANITNGVYQLNHKRTEGQYFFTRELPLDSNEEFEITAGLRQQGGVDNYGYGIAWGGQDDANTYVFYITSSEYYRVYKFQNGSLTDLVQWTTAPGIIKPLGSTNQFKIRKSGKTYQFFLNGTLLTSIPAQPLFGNKAGFVLTNSMTVEVERFAISQSGSQSVTQQETKPLETVTTAGGGIFFDSFNNNQNLWSEEASSIHSSRIYSGNYTIEHKGQEGNYFFWKDLSLIGSDTWQIEVTMKQVNGEEYGYGLVWGAADRDNLLGYYITISGYARIWRIQNGQFTVLLDWAQSGSIGGMNTSNNLKIQKQNGALTFFVNNLQVHRMADQPLFGNKLGFVLTSRMTVEVEQLQVEGLPVAEAITQKPVIQKPIVAQTRQAEPEEPPAIRWQIPDQPVTTTQNRDYSVSLELNSKSPLQNVTLLLNNSVIPFPEAQALSGKSGIITLNGNIKLLPGNNDLKIISANRAGSATSQSRSIIYNQPSPPLITWLIPSQNFSTTSSGKMEIKAGVNSTSPVTNIQVLINDIPLADANRGFTVQKQENVIAGYDQVIQKNIELRQGDNLVKLIVESQNGSITTEVRTITFNSAFASGADMKEEIVGGRKDYAVLFATSNYDNWGDLINPVIDARAVARELENNYGFEVELVENPTTGQMMTTLKKYANKSYLDKDQLFIFFAGHGTFDETFGEGYVVGANSLLNDEAKTSYLSHSTLRTVINNIPSQHTLVVMDVCFGGTFDQLTARASHRGDNGVYSELSNTEFIQRKLQYKTRRYLTSGGKDYVPDGDPGKHSPFARKLLEALRSFGGGDSILTFGEVITFMERVVPQPRTAGFGDDEPGSEFLFIAK
jgi:hypothetical protein